MRILLIDTCGAEGSVAIADTSCEPEKVVSATLPGRSASERLVGAVRDLAAKSGVALRELDAIAVVHGPGSFTGVRVGLSAAKGFCEALAVPLVAISRLAVLASMASAAKGERVWGVLDAGRGEFYLGEYLDGAKVREALVAHEDLAALIRGAAGGQVLVVCEEGVAQALASFGPKLVAEPDAATVLLLAMRRVERGEFDDVASVDANYLRRTDLEIFAKVKAAK